MTLKSELNFRRIPTTKPPLRNITGYRPAQTLHA
uniref:Uncharacterized protein n=1 Tax=Arundo donax TaxID=35708 RepID=A0A0A9DLV7_ARUDO